MWTICRDLCYILDMTSDQKKIATLQNPTIQALTKSLFRFPNEQDAQTKLDEIVAHFETSSKLPICDKEGQFAVWIKNYQLTDEDKEQGYLGHYALLTVQPTTDGKFTLTAHKQDVDNKFHPQKTRPPARHPDWGHPILKSIKKSPIFANVGLAQRELMRLHEQYPSTSIPTGAELFIMVYEKQSKPAVQKYVLTITPIENGGVTIAYRSNIQATTPPTVTEKQGSFAAKEAIRAAKKQKIPISDPNNTTQ